MAVTTCLLPCGKKCCNIIEIAMWNVILYCLTKTVCYSNPWIFVKPWVGAEFSKMLLRGTQN